jgi:heme-degrading monooxygenase HmoA
MSYYAVIFTSQLAGVDGAEYEEMALKMVALAKEQKGFIDVESVRGSDGFGITISYWENQDDIKSWKANTDHLLAQKYGRSKWYKSFKTRVCKVEREYEVNHE